MAVRDRRNDVTKKILLSIQDEHCPGLLHFLNSLPYGAETPFVRGVLYQWVLQHQDHENINELVTTVMSGPGGQLKGIKSKIKIKQKTYNSKKHRQEQTPPQKGGSINNERGDAPLQPNKTQQETKKANITLPNDLDAQAIDDLRRLEDMF
ncbi:MAG: hypothetical protein HKM02_08665 [Pseudomonadales bacterium]|nr:hypothetical protein [Pseudomonadales bacterium]